MMDSMIIVYKKYVVSSLSGGKTIKLTFWYLESVGQ